MASGIVSVTLNRDGPQTPWGFRLHGGKDIGFPMVIQRVFLGSPSEGELQRGDTLLQVQGQDAANLTHMEAYDLIKAAGTRLSLLIRRLPGAPQPPVSPTSPVPMGGMHPYAKLLRETESAARAAPKLFQPMSPPKYTPKPLPSNQPIKEYCYSPLPTTPLPDRTPFFARTPRNLAHSEIIEYHQEVEKEKDAIVRQGYRTLPLIAPRPKTRHDIPMGSYLRFVNNDPNFKGRSTIVQPSVKPPFMNQYPTPTYSTIGIDSRRAATRAPPPGAPMFERPLDEGSQLVHHQYNSPLFLYSQRNVDETIKEQTGVSASRAKLNVSTPLSPGQTAPQSPGTLAPARPGTKLSNIVDITLSPTFQMIQEEEKRRSASPQPPQEVRTPTLMRKTAPMGPRPFAFDQSNFGSSRDVIHQSRKFNSLMSQLYAPPEEHQA